MLTPEHNDLLTRVGPGTPMGEMLREYWAPVLRSQALEADGAPVRVRLLGENFVAFRSTDGRVGFFDEGCPHRCTSLALARNEDNALTCIFHGWKIDVSGKVVEVPSEPPERRAEFAAKVRVRHYPVREAGTLVWVYLGKREQPPEFPRLEFTQLPASHIDVHRGVVHYNWLQGLEAHIDSAHLGILHRSFISKQTAIRGKIDDIAMAATDNGPRFELDVTPYGLREAALRQMKDGSMYARIRDIVLPYFTFIPFNRYAPCQGRASVPIDDEWNAEFYLIYDPYKPLDPEVPAVAYAGSSGDPDNFSANLGDFDNLWHQDRRSMKEGHWSGLGRNVPFEDFTVEASMGSRLDRSREYLGSSDTIIIRARRLLLDAVRAFAEGKQVPWQSGIDFSRIRSLAISYPASDSWRSLDTIGAYTQPEA
ncbi:MAG TPA: Rieske 2Fe-2S domain-containing protein [Candidatus Binataceae bacterium]|nr:Rieske 2Fe-2S domain-containing protein [Candidatus Binataceae bacterium]